MVSSSLGALLWHYLHWTVSLIKHSSSVAPVFFKGLFLQDDSWPNTVGCKYHSPEQSPHSRGREVLFRWNKAQITPASPCEQAGICVCLEQGSIQVTHHPRKEVRRFWVTFFSCFRSSSGSSPAEGTSQTCSHEPALLLSANRQKRAGLYLPLESSGSTGGLLPPAPEHTRIHLKGGGCLPRLSTAFYPTGCGTGWDTKDIPSYSPVSASLLHPLPLVSYWLGCDSQQELSNLPECLLLLSEPGPLVSLSLT